MTTVAVIISVDQADLERLDTQTTRRIEAVLNLAMDRVLVAIELIQAHKYLSDAFPPKPSGSGYQRTFRLRKASRRERTSRSLPEIGGEWFIDEAIAPYANDVIGPRALQAEIHRGRWLSQEEIEERAEQIAPAIVQEVLDREIQI